MSRETIKDILEGYEEGQCNDYHHDAIEWLREITVLLPELNKRLVSTIAVAKGHYTQGQYHWGDLTKDKESLTKLQELMKRAGIK